MTSQEVVDDRELVLIGAPERFMRTIILGGSTEARQLSPATLGSRVGGKE